MTKIQAARHIQKKFDRSERVEKFLCMEVSTRIGTSKLGLYGALVLFGCLGLLWMPQGVSAQERESGVVESTAAIPSIGERADQILRDMSEYLSAAPEFRFRADITYDSVLLSGQKIQYGGTADVFVRRPDKLHVEYKGDERQMQAIFNGHTFTVYNVAAKVYTVTEVPSEIDAAIDKVFEEHGVSVPVADLIHADPHAILTERVETGYIIGTNEVDGRPCHHLAFTQDVIDWQIWIDAGPRPVPRKLLITYKVEPGSPQYSATFSDWNFQPRNSDHYFEFRPPAGADQIEFLPAGNEEVKP